MLLWRGGAVFMARSGAAFQLTAVRTSPGVQEAQQLSENRRRRVYLPQCELVDEQLASGM